MKGQAEVTGETAPRNLGESAGDSILQRYDCNILVSDLNFDSVAVRHNKTIGPEISAFPVRWRRFREGDLTFQERRLGLMTQR